MISLEVKNLGKKFAGRFELKAADWRLEGGQTVAFLGPNGAGKSTLFKLLAGQIEPTAGQVKIGNIVMTTDNFALKRQVGYLPQNFLLPPWVRVHDILVYAASLLLHKHPEKVAATSMAHWDCASYAQEAFVSCSHGMQKRVALALATMNHPDVLILDEPCSGLDILHIETLQQHIRDRHKACQLTILSSHVVPYVAKLCHRVFTIDNGSVAEMDRWSAFLVNRGLEERVAALEGHFLGPR